MMPAIPVSGNRYQGCPNLGFTTLQLSVPGDSEIGRNDGLDKNPGYPWPIKEATGLDVNDFYQQFKLPTDDCLETDLDQLEFPK